MFYNAALGTMQGNVPIYYYNMRPLDSRLLLYRQTEFVKLACV